MTDELDKSTEESLEDLLNEAERLLREIAQRDQEPACDFCGAIEKMMARCANKNINICEHCLRGMLAKLDDAEKLLAMETESTARH